MTTIAPVVLSQGCFAVGFTLLIGCALLEVISIPRSGCVRCFSFSVVVVVCCFLDSGPGLRLCARSLARSNPDVKRARDWISVISQDAGHGAWGFSVSAVEGYI